MAEDPCPCGSGMDYTGCCGRYLDATSPSLVATAEQLMRSRYTAYVLARETYLLQTWHVSTRPEKLALQTSVPVKWLGLKVLNIEAGNRGDQQGRVEFIARYKLNGKAMRLHETSRFVREQGQWFYVDGELH